MITRRSLLGAAGALGAASATGLLTGCSPAAHNGRDIELWGVSNDQVPNQQKVIDAFLKTAPGVTVQAKGVPTQVDGDATQVITAVRGKTAPDLWYMDRFTGSQYAAIGLLEPITPLIEKYEDKGFLDQWLQFARNELTYQGQIYGLPVGTDVRALYYNKTMLREAGVDLDELDPKNGPPTIDRIMEISNKITKKDERGNYSQLGFIPWNAQGWGYTWSVGTGSSYFDDSSCSTDLTAKPIVDAFQFLYEWGAEMGYGPVNAFEAAYEPLNHPPSQTAFLGQKLAFTVQTSTTVFALAKYAPKLDYGFTYLPVFNKGDKPYTWSGGFSIVAPKGSAMSEPVWNLMKFFAGKTGQSIFMPATKSLPTLRSLFDLSALADMRPFIEQLTYSTSRPPIPISSIWWDALTQVHSSMKIGSKPALEALQEAQARVSPQMAAYCPFKLPEGYGKTGA